VSAKHSNAIIYLLRLGADCTIKNKRDIFPLQTDQEDWSDLYQKLLDSRIVEDMPLVVLNTLPEEWFKPSNMIYLLPQLVASAGFIKISDNEDISEELMNIHTYWCIK
jgi:hypothetical protein